MGYKYFSMSNKYTVKKIEKKKDYLSICWNDNFKSKWRIRKSNFSVCLAFKDKRKYSKKIIDNKIRLYKI